MVLNTIQGCGIYFVHIPEQVTVPRQIQFDVDEVNLIKNLGFIIDWMENSLQIRVCQVI